MANHNWFDKVDAGIRDFANLAVKGATLGHYSADDVAGYLDTKIGSVDPATKGADVSKLQAAEKAKSQKLDAEIPVTQRAGGAVLGVEAIVVGVAAGAADLAAVGLGTAPTFAQVALGTAVTGAAAGVDVATLSPGGMLDPKLPPHSQGQPYKKAMSNPDLGSTPVHKAPQTENASKGESRKLDTQPASKKIQRMHVASTAP